MKRNKNLFGFLAFFCIVLAFLLSPSFLAQFLTRDGEIHHRIYFIIINFLQLSFFLFGVFLFYIVFSNKRYLRFIKYLKKNYKNYLLCFFAIILSLVLVESGLYFFYGSDLSNSYLIPLVDGVREKTYENIEYNMTVRLNSEGFRDDEFVVKKDENTIRILVLGDSYVFGMGVEQNNVFPQLFENCLNLNSLQKFEVYNFGIPGKNPYIYLQVLKKYGEKYDPDLIISGFYIGNDIMKGNFVLENFKFLSFPLFRKLIRENLLKIDTLSDDTIMYSNINPIYINYAKQGLINTGLIFQAYYYGNVSKYYDSILEFFNEDSYNKDILFNLRQTSYELNVPFILVLFPDVFQTTKYDLKQKEELGYVIDKKLVNDSRIQDSIMKFTRENKIHTIDLLPYFKKYDKPLYFELDLHFNEEGHRVTSQILCSKIKKIYAK